MKSRINDCESIPKKAYYSRCGNLAVTSNAFAMNFMFSNATSFDQPIGGWDVGKVQDFTAMFQFASAFNADLSQWDTRSAKTFSNMFFFASSFVSDLSWITDRVEDMSAMFAGVVFFNAPSLSSWNVQNVRDFSLMFAAGKLSVEL